MERVGKALVLWGWREIAWHLKKPYRAWRRSGINARLPRLPGWRSWRTAIPPRLHVTLMRGAIAYSYRGIQTPGYPMDMALYLRLLFELKPRTIIEVGSGNGGGAIWLGDMTKNFGLECTVYSVDIRPPRTPYYCPQHVKFIEGDENDLTSAFYGGVGLHHPILLIHDASHKAPGVLKSMLWMDQRSRPGDYMIVEDGFVTELGVDARWKGGPARAIADFLSDGDRMRRWTIDPRYCDHYGVNVTANPNGYLKRV